MREAATIHTRRRTDRASLSARRLRSRLAHSSVAIPDHRVRDGDGAVVSVASVDDADSPCIGFTDDQCRRLFRQPILEHLAAANSHCRRSDLYVFSTDSDTNPDPLPDADAAASDDLVWFEHKPYWSVMPVASGNCPGNGDPNVAGVRDPDADVDMHLYGEPCRDSDRDRYGRERNLT
jgi:hypothetical protein